MKYLRITMPDGTTWDVPANVIARHRAWYYVKKEENAYDNEFDYVMTHDDELLDWAPNNMDWKDVRAEARIVPGLMFKPEYEGGWINGEKRIVDY